MSRPSRKQTLFTSAVTAAGVNLLRYYPPAGTFLDGIADSVLFFLPSWAAHVVLFTAAWGFIYSILRSRIGTELYGYWQILEDRISPAFRWVFGRHKNIYTEEERGGNEFRRDMIRSATTSPFMHCLLIAGYTMVHEEEDFLLAALRGLPSDQLESKDIRFLLLERTSEHWKKRAREVVQHRLHRRGITIEHYVQLCQIAEEVIRTTLKANVAYYNKPASVSYSKSC